MDTRIVEWLISIGLSESLAIFIKTTIYVIVFGTLSILANFITKKNNSSNCCFNNS